MRDHGLGRSQMTKVKNIKIQELSNFGYFGTGFRVTINSRDGRIFEAVYTTRPTVEEIQEDFKENKKSFMHVN